MNPAVLISGAGPAGLMMACQLAIHHIPFRIIDKNSGPAIYSGALFIQARTLEMFQQMGIAAGALQQGIVATKIKILINGKNISEINLNRMGENISPFPFILMLEQSKTEQLLVDFLENYEFRIEHRTELISLISGNDRVTVFLRLPDGTQEKLEVSYLIGADGSRSTVRTLLNIPFEGRSFEKPLFIIDSITDLPSNPGELVFAFSQNAAAGFFALKYGMFRTDGFFSQSSEEITFEDVNRNFGKFTGTNVHLTNAEWFSVFHAQRRKASAFFKNRCFLLGDAARVHTPIGAQGMNTGLQDAWNLGWKLAFVFRGKAGEKLLESYPAERYHLPEIASMADNIYRLTTGMDFLTRIFRKLLFPVIVRFISGFLKVKGIRETVFKSVSQTCVRYRSAAADASKGRFRLHSPHPGDRLPYVTYEENAQIVNLQHKITGINFHLLLFSDVPVPALTRKAGEFSIQVHLIPLNSGTVHVYRRFGIVKSGYYLVRPDMYIAFRCAGLNEVELEKYMMKNGIMC